MAGLCRMLPVMSAGLPLSVCQYEEQEENLNSPNDFFLGPSSIHIPFLC